MHGRKVQILREREKLVMLINQSWSVTIVSEGRLFMTVKGASSSSGSGRVYDVSVFNFIETSLGEKGDSGHPWEAL